MFCTKCGSDLAEGAKFCVKCGTPVGAGPASAARPSPAAPQPARAPKLGVVPIIVVAVVIAGAIAYFAYPKMMTNRWLGNTGISSVQKDYAAEKVRWIQADLAILHAMCNGLGANDRKLFLKDRAFDRIAALKQRLKGCSSLSQLESTALAAQSSVNSATDLNPYYTEQGALTSALATLDSMLSSMPTPLLQGANPTSEQTEALEKGRSDGIARVRSLGERAVDVARDASERAATASASSSHTVDKTFAQQSESAYSQARSQLETAATQTGSALFETTDKLFGTTLWAIDYAQQAMGLGPSLAVTTAATATAAPYVAPTPNAIKPRPPARPATEGIPPSDAMTTVSLYYQLWNAHRYSDMYAMLSPSFHSAHEYSSWLAGKESQKTVSISVSTSPGSDPNAVNLSIDSVDAPSGNAVSSHYDGTWWLVRINGRLYLDHTNL